MKRLANLAIFRALSPAEPTGGAVLDPTEGIDALDALMSEGSSFLDEVNAPTDFAAMLGEGDEPPEGAEGEGEPAELAEGAEEGAVTLPESLDVDGEPVPLADVMEGYRANKANAELIDLGTTYQGALEVFSTGPEGARAVIETMITEARKQYGDESVAGLGAPIPLPADFNEEDATPNEKALIAHNFRLQRTLESQRAEFERTLDELKPVVRDRTLNDASEAYAAKVNAQISGANVDAKGIVAMMKETGLDDPVKAYKLANFDKVAEAAQTKTVTKPASTMPRQGLSNKTFDPMDKSISADRMVQLLSEGYKPLKTAAAS